MKVLQGDKWVALKDYFRPEVFYRLRVHRWVTLASVNDVYVQPERNFRKIWNYRSLGPKPLIKKIVSRLGESQRNAKFISVGVGVVAEGPKNSEYETGDVVYFVAPLHPAGCDRIVLPEVCLRRAANDETLSGYWHATRDDHGLDAILAELKGWDPESGASFDATALWNEIPTLIDGSEFSEIDVATRFHEEEVSVTDVAIFGFGHHVRTNILPCIKKSRDVAIFERDPTLHDKSHGNISTMTKLPVGSCPKLTIIATYHHTHATLACDAMDAGSLVVLEKPVATTVEQLKLVVNSVERGGKMFVAFHKRYSEFNAFLETDLAIGSGRSFSYHCTVHEIRLPQNHWYRWPNSGSRILSNGCHWIDHFLFLNDYCPVVTSRAKRLGGSEIVCELELENGSVFTMTLTDRGSDRIGVRETIDIFCGEKTARIRDFTEYIAEDGQKVLRETSIDKLAVYPKMYTSFFDGRSDEKVETIRQLEVSAGTILALEAMLD